MGTHNGTDPQPIPNNWHSERYGSCCGRKAHRKGGEMEYFMGEKSDNKWYCWWFRNPANQLRLLVYPIIYKVLYIPGGAGFLPSTVVIPSFFFLGGGEYKITQFEEWDPSENQVSWHRVSTIFWDSMEIGLSAANRQSAFKLGPPESHQLSCGVGSKISPQWNPSDSRPPTWG